MVAAVMDEAEDEGIDGETAEEIEEDLRDTLEPEELPETFRRWGEIAGIIKG